MGSNKIDRVGEKNINNFGSEMVIIRYENANNIDVYFPEYDWIAKNTRYDVLKKVKLNARMNLEFVEWDILVKENIKLE